MTSAGVVYVVYGNKAKAEAERSIQALRTHCDLPVSVIGERIQGTDRIAFPPHDAGGRWAKVNLDKLTPYDLTLYLDADTRPLVDIRKGFEMLRAGWELVLTPSGNQDGEAFWHVSEEERRTTYEELGYVPLQLQAGVMFLRACEAISKLFGAWRSEWLRWSGQDQAALVRALAKSPVRVWLLGRPWNGGAVVAHHFGQARMQEAMTL